MESEVSAPPAMATEVKTEVKTELLAKTEIKTEALVEANDESVLERTPKKARAQTTLPFSWWSPESMRSTPSPVQFESSPEQLRSHKKLRAYLSSGADLVKFYQNIEHENQARAVAKQDLTYFWCLGLWQPVAPYNSL